MGSSNEYQKQEQIPMKQSLARSLSLAILLAGLGAGCATSTHQTTPASLGKPVSAEEMERLLDHPGPVELKSVASVDWSVSLGGLLNLDSPKAKEAGIKDRDEPIQIYAHILRHPTQGFYMVDTGVSKKLVDAPSEAGVSWGVRKGMHLDRMKYRQWTHEAIEAEKAPLKGVFLTHMHIDHISGMPDVPNDTPIYTGPGEAEDSHWFNAVVQSTTNHLLEGKGPLQEFRFSPDPSGRFEGILDLFGDGSVFAIRSTGHTAGSVAYVVRTPSGPVLLTGDTCHTRWGWESSVEPGGFTVDREKNLKNLLALKALVARHPGMAVRLGHQP
jgi:glyoxylase-like metal-dependent hydrolase (beta-lactamase superfamily II)